MNATVIDIALLDEILVDLEEKRQSLLTSAQNAAKEEKYGKAAEWQHRAAGLATAVGIVKAAKSRARQD